MDHRKREDGFIPTFPDLYIDTISCKDNVFAIPQHGILISVNFENEWRIPEKCDPFEDGSYVVLWTRKIGIVE